VLLIDGYNLLFKVRGFDPQRLNAERDRLVVRITRYCAATGIRTRIFFDPRRDGAAPFDRVRRKESVEIVELAEITADEAILALVVEGKDRTAYRVISSDREVAGTADKRGFDAVASEDFLAELEDSERGVAREKPDGISAAEAERWMREFGLGGKSDEARGAS
jgi:predicted RNA-binding protein with PIN domain